MSRQDTGRWRMLFWHGTMRCAKRRARWSAIARPAPARVCAMRCAHMTRRIYKQGGERNDADMGAGVSGSRDGGLRLHAAAGAAGEIRKMVEA